MSHVRAVGKQEAKRESGAARKTARTLHGKGFMILLVAPTHHAYYIDRYTHAPLSPPFDPVPLTKSQYTHTYTQTYTRAHLARGGARVGGAVAREAVAQELLRPAPYRHGRAHPVGGVVAVG